MDREEKLIEIFKRYPIVVHDRNRMRALLMDYFPEDKLLFNLLMDAYDGEILKEIDKSKVLNNTVLRGISKRLTREYGLQKEKARDIILLYFRTYGKVIRKKKIDIKEEYSDTIKETITAVSQPSVILPPETETGEEAVSRQAVKISSIPDGGKFPRNLLVRYPDEEELLGIEELTCTMRKRDWYKDKVSVELIGEVIGAPLDQDILIIAMAINDRGQMIGANYHNRIYQKDFIGLQTFSETLWVPEFETIREIRLRPVIDIVLQE